MAHDKLKICHHQKPFKTTVLHKDPPPPYQPTYPVQTVQQRREQWRPAKHPPLSWILWKLTMCQFCTPCKLHLSLLFAHNCAHNLHLLILTHRQITMQYFCCTRTFSIRCSAFCALRLQSSAFCALHIAKHSAHCILCCLCWAGLDGQWGVVSGSPASSPFYYHHQWPPTQQ